MHQTGDTIVQLGDTVVMTAQGVQKIRELHSQWVFEPLTVTALKPMIQLRGNNSGCEYCALFDPTTDFAVIHRQPLAVAAQLAAQAGPQQSKAQVVFAANAQEFLARLFSENGVDCPCEQCCASREAQEASQPVPSQPAAPQQVGPTRMTPVAVSLVHLFAQVGRIGNLQVSDAAEQWKHSESEHALSLIEARLYSTALTFLENQLRPAAVPPTSG
jgi:hypothetical protein